MKHYGRSFRRIIVLLVSMGDQEKCGKVREHSDEGKRGEICRGYSDGMYERLKSGVCEENVAEKEHSFLAAETQVLGDKGAVKAETATGEGKAE